ncbi:MAG: hypothetical protein ACC682_03365 [Gemmatimonadota bacterium]
MSENSHDRRNGWSPALPARAGALLVAAALGAWFPSPASPQQIDAGRLALRDGGQRVGVESFRVWEAGANLNSVANVEPSAGRGGEFQVGLELDGQFRPVRYRLLGPDGRVVEGIWSVDRVQVHTVTSEGERWREIASRGPSTVLEVGVAHHYLVLAHLLRETGGRATVVVPLLGESFAAELVGEQPSEVEVDRRPIAATRYDIEVDGQLRQVWVDAEGRLLRVLDTVTGREAVRLPPR